MMPRPRLLLEWLLRAVATGVLAVLLWRSLNSPARARTAMATEGQIAGLLPRWTTEGRPDTASIRLRQAPGAQTRDWLAALRRAGTSLTWHSDSLAPSALTAEPLVDPAGGLLVRVGAATGMPLILTDEAGTVDSANSANSSATFKLAALAGTPRVRARGQLLATTIMDSVQLRRVLVLGRVGWEAKFTIAALEERGWIVDARLLLSPGSFVAQGPPASLDTARYSAVILLDSASALNPGVVVRYVDDGGGAIIAGTAGRVASLQTLLPGRAGKRIVPRQRLADTADGEGARHAIVDLKSDAIVLQRDDSINTVAARRVGAGRVIQLADEETWRKRMHHSPGSESVHREWWARVVASVAYAPRFAVRAPGDEAAPVASLVEALGAPSAQTLSTGTTTGRKPEPWLFALAVLALLAEWTSRRWRGAP